MSKRPRFSALRSARLMVALFAMVVIALLAAGCDVGDADTPQNTLNPAGEVADKQRDMFLLAMWPALVVMIVVEGAIIVTVLRYRRRKSDEMPKQTHGNTPLEIGWTIIPTLIIIGFVGVPMLPVLFEIGRDPKADAFPIEVQGEQFQWTFTYPEILDNTGQPAFTFGGEVHVPAGREVALTIRSIDVNHSFGVPRIAGTRDAIKGREERMWIKADEPGTFHGQCRELCGVGHANMLITMIAHDEEDFEAWADEISAGTRSAPDASAPAAVSGAGE